MAKHAPNEAKEIRHRISKWRNYFKTNIDQYHRMHTFVLGAQWTDDEASILKKNKKVPLQFNKLATLINTLLGEQQQNTPQLEVVPMADATEQTAHIRELLVKDIMLSTDSKLVYQFAASQAFIGGFGAFCIDTRYVHDKSFDQEIVYSHFKDATKCYWDPSADNPDKTDGMYGGYIERISRRRFREIYGKKIEAKVKSVDDAELNNNQDVLTETQFNWADDSSIAIIYDYDRNFKKDTLYKLSNGRVLDQAEIEELAASSLEHIEQLRAAESLMADEAIEEDFRIGVDGVDEDGTINPEIISLYDNMEPVRIEEKRTYKRSYIKLRVCAGDYILDESEFPSEDIPVIFVDQNSYYDKNGRQICRPFLIDAVDTQRYINYLGTQAAFILKISRYDQFIGSKENVRSNDTAKVWKDPQNVQGLLFYDESKSGAKPEQLRPPELSQSLVQQYEKSIEDLYTCTGLYPTRLGQQGNEISGAAIDARTRQGSYPTFVAFNSLNRAITCGGKIVNQMIPRVYDSERVLSLMTPDRGRQNVVVNKQSDAYNDDRLENDITKGTYEVRLQAGPSYEGQKQQALESLNAILSANPSLLNIIADLYAENLPLANTIEIKNRLKTLVPPEIIQAGQTGQMPKKSQQPNAQDQAALAAVQQKQEEIELKKAELQMKIKEAQSKNQIAMLELEMQRLETIGKLEAEKLRFMAETDRTHSDNAISHADNITKLITESMKTQRY